jgi:hypothetical protein
MISILTSLDHFVFEKMFLISVDCLLGSIIPTRIDPFLTFRILPSSIDLGNDGLREIVRILKMDPITFLLVSMIV